VRPLVWLADFFRDLRVGSRQLLKAPSFFAITVSSLALGIGGSTAMYSVIHAVILDPFIYKDVDRLMSVQVLGAKRGSNGSYYSIDHFLDVAEHNSVFSGTIASTWSDVTWTGDGDPQRIRGNHCTMNTFDVMGVPALIGRTTPPSDAKEGAEPVAVLGYKFWQQQFGGDSSVLKRKLILNGKSRTVIGVMPQRFMWRGADVYLPDVFHRGQDLEGDRDVHLMGRLKPGVSVAQATADLSAVVADLRQSSPNDFPKDPRVRLETFKETFPSDITDALWILFGAVALLLLIACINVSNLLLSKMATRQRELSIRASIGASRMRLVSQLLSETLVLAVSGGLLGVLAAYAGLRGIIAAVPPGTIPDEAQITLNAPVLWFTLAVSLGAALFSGLAPALHSSSQDVISPMKESGRGITGGKRRQILRGILVVSEVALSLMLLMGASLMIRTLLSIENGDVGVPADHILTMRIPFSHSRVPGARIAFLQDVLSRVSAVPGVTAAGVNTGFPPMGNWTVPVEIAGASSQDGRSVMLHQISQDYPRAMGIALVRGRLLSEQDVFGKIHNAVINEAFAARYFANGDALGRLVKVPRMSGPPINEKNPAFQIVGVTKNIVNQVESHETIPEMFIPFTVAGSADRLFVASSLPPQSLNRAVRDQVYAVDRAQPVTEDKPLQDFLEDYVYARPRFNLLLFSVFAALGLVLAVFGVYGVVSNTVAQRTHEIGIRIALGASFWQIIRMILAMGMKLVGLGIAIGLAGSVAAVRLISGLVQNVSPFDPYSFIAVTILLFSAGIAATIWPSRNAARLDPLDALRHD
jgi:predicted permease